jgi:hypothetical protein
VKVREKPLAQYPDLCHLAVSSLDSLMPKRSSKKRKPGHEVADSNVPSLKVVEPGTREDAAPTKPKAEKNPAAVTLGRLGGKKGGKARAEKLSAKELSEIAKKAARARWAQRTPRA